MTKSSSRKVSPISTPMKLFYILIIALSPVCGMAVSHSHGHSSGHHGSHHSTHPSHHSTPHSTPHTTPHSTPHITPHFAPRVWHPATRASGMYHPFPSTNHMLMYWMFFRPHTVHPVGAHVSNDYIDHESVGYLALGVVCSAIALGLTFWLISRL